MFKMEILQFAVCAFLVASTAAASIASAGVHVSLSGDFRAPGLQGESCNLPDVINFTITSGDVIFSLEVSKSPRVTQDAPVYVIGDDGQVRRANTRDRETYALYLDLDTGSSVVVTCPLPGEEKPAVEGTVTYEGRQFHLRHSSRRRRDVTSLTSEDEEYQLTEVPEDHVKGQVIDYVLPSDDHSLPKVTPTSRPGMEQEQSEAKDGTPSIRFRRQAVMMRNVYIDTTVVIAFDIYQKFFNESAKTTESEKKADATERIRKYYALLMNEVDMHYRLIGNRLPYNISIGLASFVIAESSAAFPWMETLKRKSAQSDRFVVDSETMLDNLTSWIASSSSFPAMDYYVMITGYNLSSNSSGIDHLGLAWVGTVCASNVGTNALPGYNSAVVEDGFYATTILTVAHEIGHGFGAKHDGDSNDCFATDSYIMAPTQLFVNGTHHGLFSSCSLNDFNSTFTKLSSSGSESCIHEITSPAGVPNVTDLVPGQVYDVQTQCKRAYGNGSSVCPSLTTLGDTMCYKTYCTDPQGSSLCQTIPLFRGTTCGDKKWCFNGFCVSSPNAPSLDEPCPFRDREGKIYSNSNETCRELVSKEPMRCYNSNFNATCCETCNNIKKNRTGCEFGDRLRGCQLWHCTNQSYWQDCCDTCAAYIPPPSTTSTTTTTPTSVSKTRPTVNSACAVFSSQDAGFSLIVLAFCFVRQWGSQV